MRYRSTERVKIYNIVKEIREKIVSDLMNENDGKVLPGLSTGVERLKAKEELLSKTKA